MAPSIVAQPVIQDVCCYVFSRTLIIILYSTKTYVRIIRHLTKERWVVLLAAESPEVDRLTDAHFDSQILKRIKLQDDNDIWMVPLITLVGPCFVVYNKNYCENTINNVHADDRLAYIVEPTRKWRNAFLPSIIT